ncbi:DNA-directed RNA polymerase II 19 kDa polypeptide [Trichodelitschia bisporula]|uniref:DNA-directed RNA polymerase subunit n=1 Tax=Trichodelitschia bisporula TaxID=703511 RepID=A0A6G1HNC6_9PEZI|nr:DNA-directed RNA polymerase II 19 kDa polypeptide [Trichodelitschia bisporula]
MFFLKDEERLISLHPSFFGPNIQRFLSEQLIEDVEGKNVGDYFVVCVLDQYDFSEGRVIPGRAFAEFNVHYKAVVWKPFKGEVMDGEVTSVSEAGFFVEIGPLQAFVAKTMIPSEIKFDGHATPPQWSDNGEQVIEKGSQVRIKIKGVRNELGTMYAIATIKEDYLGTMPS